MSVDKSDMIESGVGSSPFSSLKAVSDGDETVLPLADASLSDAFGQGDPIKELGVRLSNEIVVLLSEQLYTSPLKAIEELVANSYDADGTECRIGLLMQDREDGTPDGLIAVYDDGSGMDKDALAGLWQIGDSPKKWQQSTTTSLGRRMIGKFGIGKLATYAIANRITYVTKASGQVLHVLCDFTEFNTAPSGGVENPVKLKVREVTNLASLLERDDLKAVLSKLGLDADALHSDTNPDWTLCLLDDLKPSAATLQIGRLSWVLRTAMPLKLDFKVYLDGAEQISSKEAGDPIIKFAVGGLDGSRIKALNEKHGLKLARSDDGDALVEPNWFPSGISGDVIVTEQSLKGKSDRYERSFGFFVRVRGRLINLEDPLFHNSPLSFSTFNRFRADLEIDDLHNDLTAPREGVGVSSRREFAVAVTHEIGLQARDRYQIWLEKKSDQKQTPEHVRVYVAEHLVERPMADALALHGSNAVGGEIDRSWMYMENVDKTDIPQIVQRLYEKRTTYQYDRVSMGKTQRLGKFDPTRATFLINADHQIVQAFGDDPMANQLVNLLATAEVMLEVYMVESDLDPFTIGDLLTRRDLLMRSLANDRVFSKKYIAQMLRESSDSDIDLELALVAAARALGFQVRHVAGSGQPDGVARFLDTAMNETKITLEAKASSGTPQLPQLDFAGLMEHRQQEGAAGCLLIAPSYPAPTEEKVTRTGNPGAVANRASGGDISCWTIQQLATVVENSDRLEITTQEIAEIVTTKFAPRDVTAAIAKLLDERTDMPAIYAAVMSVLDDMFNQEQDKGVVRTISAISGALMYSHPHLKVGQDIVRDAIKDLARNSRGGMKINKDVIIFLNGFDEVQRAVAPLLGTVGAPRALGTFSSHPSDG
ncbi:ATP-binding protein [Glacieibacterium megasporae]|uniref:ATP-binding protein n=1 Tax=Glacieibacterium megasporae TaxID=2835787 RepID=UPI001C1DF34F|nr:ATP-binding protein [Polymorphobacter megasporae]UAJ10622.1 ATP-binding protein [Polymorphobacter megasporae]